MLEEERPYHEVANIFPLLQGEEFSSLKDSIATNGLLVPIWLDADGRIIDGRNRHRACIETGTPPTFQTWNGNGSLVSFVVSLNKDRRHLTKSQLAASAVNIKRELAKEIEAEKRAEAVRREAKKRAEREAEEREESGQQAMFEPDPPEESEASEEFEDRTSFAKNGKTGRNAREEAAAAVGVSHGYLGEAEKLLKEAPDLFEKVRTGEMSLSRAKRELNHRNKVEPPPMSGKYRVIYADPPWSYNNSGFDQSAAQHYPTMTTDDICALPVSDISDTPCVLYLWATVPLLPDALRVMEAWGFEYKSHRVWKKDRAPGIGWWGRTYHELLLIGTTNGNNHPSDKLPSVIDAPVDVHSRKPAIFRKDIESVHNGPYVELFCRTPSPNWDAWGNEPDVQQ